MYAMYVENQVILYWFSRGRHMTSYRLSGKQFLLTYPHLDCENEVFRDLLLGIRLPRAIQHWIICTEPHADGTPHMHLYILFTDRIELRNGLELFTINGVRPNNAGNIRSPRAAAAYCCKGSNYITDNPEWLAQYVPKLQLLPHDMLAKHSTKEAFLDAALRQLGWTGAKAFNSLQSLADYHYSSSSESYTSPYPANSFCPPTELATTVHRELHADRPRTIILVGPSRYGKTAWARSLGVHVYMKSNLNFNIWNNNLQYLILDDIPWPCLKRYQKDLIGGQERFTANEKYSRKRTITFGKLTILITNDHPISWDDMDMHYYNSYFVNNTIVCDVNEKLFRV